MAITVDATSTSTAQSGFDTFSWSHTCASDASLLIISVATRDGGGNYDVSGVTYNGVSCTKAIDVQSSGINAEIWYLINPASGAHDVTVTAGSTDYGAGGAVSLKGTKRSTSVLNATNTRTAGTGDPTLSVTTTENGCYVIDCVYSDLNSNLTVGADQTQIFQVSLQSGSDRGCGSYKSATTAGSVTMGWSGNNGNSQVVAAFSPSKGIKTIFIG